MRWQCRAEFAVRWQALPGVRVVGGTTDPVLAGRRHVSGMRVEGYPTTRPAKTESVETPEITPGYFKALGIPLIAGRDLTEGDTRRAQKVAVVNQTFAVKYFGSPQKALGHYWAGTRQAAGYPDCWSGRPTPSTLGA